MLESITKPLSEMVDKLMGMDPNDPMGVETQDITYDGAAGPLPARVCKPEGASPDKPLPVILYFHGGGFVIAVTGEAKLAGAMATMDLRGLF